MITVHPDLTFFTNYNRITAIIARFLDDMTMKDGLSWYSESPFLFSCQPTTFNFLVVDPETGKRDLEKEHEYMVQLNAMIEFVPKVMNGCPVCRTTRVLDPTTKDRIGDVCTTCHSARTFNMHVTSRFDVQNFCEHHGFKLPSTYGGL